jgi:ferric-dicitrate binding protein FerR (iron transport regulator)
VLGTHFNINSYADEPYTKTTLLEGSVVVSENEHRAQLLLKPGQAAFNNGAALKVLQVNTEADISWKNGYFTFKKADLKTVMRQFARWYDVEVAYEGNIPDVELTGDVYRNVNASQALKILSYFNIHYKIQANKITITN